MDMATTFESLTFLLSPILWLIVYIDMIRRGFKDRACGMPLFALAFNFAWELLFGPLKGGAWDMQRIANTAWCAFDIAIVVTYFMYGRKDFPARYARRFFAWSMAAFAVALLVVAGCIMSFGWDWGAAVCAFAQNLMMSVLFVDMLVRRNGIEGQSMTIAICKWLGTLVPVLQAAYYTTDPLLIALGIGIFLYDVLYIVMLYRKFRELGLNPFTRRPLQERKPA